ncbi:MAG TPA: hypothetical protein VMG32_00205, partial [Anaeromyxobacteraceae bacterium]|nr:hypothetical protein [Anaeromyxobacteraceae bacterium]
EDGAPVFTGPGDLDYLCGACGMLLCEGVRPGLFVGVLFACRCGAENQVPPGNALVDRQPTLVRPVDLPE